MKQQQRFFWSLFLFGTLVAVAGWLAEWNLIRGVMPLIKHTALIAGAGHLMQVVGVFGSLVTPDQTKRDEDA